jgi:hypothetical protein
VQTSPGHVRWAATVAGVVLLGIGIAVVVGAFGLFGFAPPVPAATRVEARVITGVGCDQGGGAETVAFTLDGRERRARFDGCGHQPGEPVEVAVPAGHGDGELTVHAARATTGAAGPRRAVGLVLLVVSGIAGAGYAYLVRFRGLVRPPMTLR